MKVRATQLGFYDNARRRPGDIFDVTPEGFSKSWMEKLDAPVAAQPKTEPEVRKTSVSRDVI